VSNDKELRHLGHPHEHWKVIWAAACYYSFF
jgi:hypothetical protein